MRPLLFIHGTGTRRKSFEKTVAVVKRHVAAQMDGYAVHECYWGEPYGSKPPANSVPKGPAAQYVRQAEEVVLWQRLLEDPYYELRLLESLPASPSQGLNVSPGEEIWQKLEDLDLSAGCKAILEDNELTIFFGASLEELLTEREGNTLTPHWKSVIEAATEGQAIRTAVAHCLIAQMINKASAFFLPPIDPDDRNRLCDHIVDALGGRDKGLGLSFAKLLMGSALLLSNPAIRADRGDFSSVTGPTTGDILVYQARGQGIRDHIESCILAASKSDPVVIVAHSLGGIATLDLLIQKDLWKEHVKALVTVGSQGSYLYEIGALWSLERTERSALPAHFPKKRWLNIMNRWDFLSYPTACVFPAHADDYEVTGVAPFPLSHSAYWKKKEMWREIQRFVDRIPV